MIAGRAAVAERVRRTREEQERAVGEQSDAERRERGGEQVGVVAAVARPRARASPAARARRTPRSRAAAVATCCRAPTGADRRTRACRRAPASTVSSGRIVVWIGCARIAYGARNATKQNWYATTPPATWLPITSAAPSRTATSGCSATHAESQSRRRSLRSTAPSVARETEARAQERDRRHADEADDPERAADGEHQLLVEW